jgi:3-oxoacyl-[acyl-carrier protein] reductase
LRALVITGASRGIGFATAQHFAARGFTVFNLSRSSVAAENIRHIEVDLGSCDWQKTINSTLLPALSAAEQIVLVHNAAANIHDSLQEFSADDFRHMLEVNVVAPAQLGHLLLPQMRAGSSIIYIGSTLSEIAVSNSCAYVTSKHALIGLMRSTCQDLAGTGIHTACICPGFTDTEMLRQHVGNSEGVLQAIAAGVTQKRLIQPAEIARTVYFCAENAVINGAVIHANLGQIQS